MNPHFFTAPFFIKPQKRHELCCKQKAAVNRISGDTVRALMNLLNLL